MHTWRIGSGPSPYLSQVQANSSKVEALFCPSGNSHGARHARKSIKSVHAVIVFHPQSGALMLRNICTFPILYEAGGVQGEDLILHSGSGMGTSAGSSASCVHLQRRNCLHFGEYGFTLEFNLQPQYHEGFTRQRNELANIQPPKCLAPVLSANHYTQRDVRVHGQLSQRSSCESVYCGVHLHSGQAVAMKGMAYVAGETDCRVRKELQIAAVSASDGSDGLLSMVTSWCGHGESPPYWGEKERQGAEIDGQEDIFYTMPLAVSDFDTLPPAQWCELPHTTRLEYSHQTLSGLGMIHAMGVVHGKVRPKSLLILRHSGQEPATMAVLSSAVHSRVYGAPDHPGSWVAPEVWTSSEEDCYSSKADIWALAASWLRAFVVPPAGITKVSAGIHRVMIRTLAEQRRLGKISDPLHDLLSSMLAWNPEDRPSVEQALCHVVWEPLQVLKQQKDAHQRRRRETIRGDSTKKVRALSPERSDYYS